ncbi:Kelch repeat-containing protein [Microbulbifer taiwanensis]|uniref:Kelch repeat-containing protein n=2 Tax=Microbulbifer taiwanensis TaxID=986746 RepID=A0ABW1YIU0_9GAMM|nr:kelch repeat-containing protein [Microbulbifer taiwanensis]
MQEIYPAVYRGQIYVGGGLGAAPAGKGVMGSLAPMEQVFRFDPHGDRWSPIAALPVARHHLGLVSDEKSLFGIGGFSAVAGNAWQFEATVFRWSYGDPVWQRGPDLPRPQAESCYACANGDIHVIGGRTADGDTAHHWRLRDDDRWEKAAPLSLARNSAACVLLDGELYVMGGRIYDRGHENQSLVERYDPVADRWQMMAPLPVATAGTAAAVMDGEIYLFGGEALVDRETASERWSTYRDVWRYDPRRDSWSRAGVMPGRRHGMGAVALHNHIYLMGGASGAGIDGTLASVDILST